MNRDSIKKKYSSKIIWLIIYILCIIMSISLLLHILNDKDKYFFGYTARIVASGSMEPDIKVNSFNVFKECDINDIKVGDIVCFNMYQDIVHRVIEVTHNDNGVKIIHTKGDANDKPDDIEIYNDMLVGKLVYNINAVAPIIERYSISPGNIDSVTLSRNMIAILILIGLVIFIVSWIISTIRLIFYAFKKDIDASKQVDTYIDDIDQLIIYREILKEIMIDNSCDDDYTGIRYILNRISLIKATIEINNLHKNIKEFKKQLRHAKYINALNTKLDSFNKISTK